MSLKEIDLQMKLEACEKHLNYSKSAVITFLEDLKVTIENDDPDEALEMLEEFIK